MFALLVFAIGYALPLGFSILVGFPLIRPNRWWLLDWIGVGLPGVAWLFLTGNYDDRGRTFSNLIELPLLALAVALIGMLRGHWDSRLGRLGASLLYLLLGLACCLAFYYLFPSLPA